MLQDSRRLAVSLFLFLVLLDPRPAAAVDEKAPYVLKMEDSAAGRAVPWAGEALDLYLDSFVGEVSTFLEPEEMAFFTVTARLLREGDDLVYLIHVESEDGRIADTELRGPPTEVAAWLSDLAFVMGRTVLPASARDAGWKGPTASTAALLSFLQSGGNGGYEEKIRLLQRALAEDPYFAEARWQLGVLFFAAGELQSALDAFERYLEARPGSARAAHNSGVCALRMSGRVEKERGAAAAEEIHLAPHRTSRSSVWLTSLPVFEPEETGAEKGPPTAGGGEGIRKVPDSRAGEPFPPGEGGTGGEEADEHLRRNRTLAELARKRELLAIRLAQEALAAQRQLREARERILELEEAADAPAGRKEAHAPGEENERLVEEAALLKEEVRALAEAAEKQAERVRRLEAERDSLRRSLEAVREEVTTAVETEKERREACEREMTAAEERAGEALSEREGLERRIAELAGERDALADNLERTEKELRDLLSEVEEARERTARLSGEKAGLEERLAGLEKEMEVAAGEADRARKSAEELASVAAERDALGDLNSRLERDLAREGEERDALEVRLERVLAELEAERDRVLALEKEQRRLEEIKVRLARRLREAAMRTLEPGRDAAAP